MRKHLSYHHISILLVARVSSRDPSAMMTGAQGINQNAMCTTLND